MQYFLPLFIPKPTFFSSIEEFFVGESISPDIVTRDESASLSTHVPYQSLVYGVYLVIL